MSTDKGFCEHCISGTVHRGTAAGREDEIGGLATYVSEPSSGSKSKSLVFITDVFGWKTPNVRLLADQYSKAGFYCYVPDLHEGDSLPYSFLDSVEPNMKTREALSLADKAKNAAVIAATLPPWLLKHPESKIRPMIDGFINTLRMTPGTDKVGTIGFCWGGRYAVLEAQGPATNEEGATIGGADAAMACHPAFLSVPADIEPISRPITFAIGDKDGLIDADTIGKIQDVIAKKTELPHELRIYEGQIHGFTIRGDWSNDGEKKAMDEAEKQGIEWFNTYLK